MRRPPRVRRGLASLDPVRIDPRLGHPRILPMSGAGAHEAFLKRILNEAYGRECVGPRPMLYFRVSGSRRSCLGTYPWGNSVRLISLSSRVSALTAGAAACIGWTRRTPALAVVVSAILDALAPLGVRDITMPATPFKVWQAIRDAEAKAPPAPQ